MSRRERPTCQIQVALLQRCREVDAPSGTTSVRDPVDLGVCCNLCGFQRNFM